LPVAEEGGRRQKDGRIPGHRRRRRDLHRHQHAESGFADLDPGYPPDLHAAELHWVALPQLADLAEYRDDLVLLLTKGLAAQPECADDSDQAPHYHHDPDRYFVLVPHLILRRVGTILLILASLFPARPAPACPRRSPSRSC